MFVEEKELEQLKSLVLKHLGPEEHCAFEISSFDFISFDSTLAVVLFHHPSLLLPIFDEVFLYLIYDQQNLLSSNSFLGYT
jgi:hypothetical protein